MNRQLDTVFVNFSDQATVYQSLSNKWTAIEPPTFSLLFAEGLRRKGYGCAILDFDATGATIYDAVEQIWDLNPRLVVFYVMGSNPNSSSANMGGNLKLAKLLKETYPQLKICFGGSHTSALPLEILSYKYVDIIVPGEGFLALNKVLSTNFSDSQIRGIPGLGWKDLFGLPQLTNGEIVKSLDEELPGYAWDLLPYKDKPLDLYRGHYWANNFSVDSRTPYAALYSSMGCPKKCHHCMINIINRTNMDEGIHAADSSVIRFWSTATILGWYQELVEKYGVKNIRLSDELFFLKPSHYQPMLNGLVDRGYNLNQWAYSRIDTMKEKDLPLLKKSGINWLAYGVESLDDTVRREIDKGSFEDVKITDVIKKTRDEDINVIANYIFGLPEDTHESMLKTLTGSLELCTEFVNYYGAMALPGSPLYHQAKAEGWHTPQNSAEFSFLSYETVPLQTKTLSSAEVLAFRDFAFDTYMKYPKYLKLVNDKFGLEAKQKLIEMSSTKIRRKILEY